VSSGDGATGRIFDIGFRRYDGPREGRRRAVLAIYKDGLRAALGLGRGGRAKIVPWLFIGASLIPAAFLALLAGAVDRLAPDFDPSQDLPSHADFYGITSIVLLVFGALVGAELFCPDRRTRVISLYLVRPLRPTDYAIARWLALLTVMLAATWLPQLVLLAGLVLGASDPGSYLADNWLDVPRFLLSGLALAAYVATLAALVASFTARRAYAAAFLVGAFVISAAVVAGATDALDVDTGRWVALGSVRGIPLYVNDLVFGGESSGSVHAAQALPSGVIVGWYLLVVAACAGGVLWRYRRLSV